MKRYFLVSYWKNNEQGCTLEIDCVMDGEQLLDMISNDFNQIEWVQPIDVVMIKGEEE